MAIPETVKTAIDGLTFRTAQVVEEPDEAGAVKKKAVPVRRPMTEADVLAWKEVRGGVVVVSKDGMKHRIASGKKPAATDKNGGGTGPKGNGGAKK